MNELERETSGWSVGKVLGLILGLLGMVGFGLCSALGFVFVFSGDLTIIMMTALGVVMTFLSGWLFVTMIRRARENRGRDR
jgi:uncharacterized membrane protein